MIGEDVTVARAIEIRRRIEQYIRNELQALIEETGLIPRAITFDLLDVTQMINRDPRYIVGEVKVRVEL